ncbi:MAG: hypothetical protein ACFCVK_11965 [Acidimicrobiales bacterium]
MPPPPSVVITAAHLNGTAFWDPLLQTFAVQLEVFAPGPAFPPPVIRHGTRFAELVTVDALANHLRALDLEPDRRSVAALDELGRATFVHRRRPEVVGLSGADGRRRLHLLTPSGALVGFGPRCAHPHYEPDWGHTGASAVEAARLICERVWVRHPHQDIEAFALALALEHLAVAGPDFSLDAVALCDWFLTDCPVGTSLDPAELARLKIEAGLAPTVPPAAPALPSPGWTTGSRPVPAPTGRSPRRGGAA